MYAKSFSALVATVNASTNQENTQYFIRDFVAVQLTGKIIWDFWDVERPFTLLSELFDRNGKSAIEPRLLGHMGKNTLEAVYQIGLYSDQQFLASGENRFLYWS